MAIAACVASAWAYAVGALVQEHVADRPLRLLLRLPSWWGAVALNGLGGLLHVVALRYGPLSLVQPFGVLTLVVAVPLAAVVARRAVTRLEWHGMALTVAGLGGILVATGSAGVGVLGAGDVIGLLLVTAIALTALAGASGLWVAAAGGIAFGVSSALTQTATVRLTAGDFGLLSLVTALAVAVLATLGLMFTQRSFRAGLSAPLAVGTLTNPVVAAAIGLVLLGEEVAGGRLGLTLALCSAAGAGLGVALLVRASSGPRADLGLRRGQVLRRAPGQPAAPRAQPNRGPAAG